MFRAQVAHPCAEPEPLAENVEHLVHLLRIRPLHLCGEIGIQRRDRNEDMDRVVPRQFLQQIEVARDCSVPKRGGVDWF